MRKDKKLRDLKSMSIILPAPPPDGSVGVERTKEGTWRAAMAVTLHKDARVLNQGQRVELKDAPPRVKAHITRYVGCAALLELASPLFEDLFDVLATIDELSAFKLHIQVTTFLFNERQVLNATHRRISIAACQRAPTRTKLRRIKNV